MTAVASNAVRTTAAALEVVPMLPPGSENG